LTLLALDAFQELVKDAADLGHVYIKDLRRWFFPETVLEYRAKICGNRVDLTRYGASA
jgi:hypothetical protein